MSSFVRFSICATYCTLSGKNGTYYGYASRNAAIIRSIFVYRKNRWDPDLIDAVVDAASETLLYSKENVRTKLDTISLLICIIMKYPEDYKRNIEVYTKLYEQNESISASGNSFFEANIDSISLQICLNLLFTAMDVDTYTKILELFPLIQNDTATSISVARIVDEYFEVSDAATLPTGVEAVVLQNVLAWLRSDCLDLRCIASRICLALARNPNNGNIVEHQLINLIDSDCAYIKNVLIGLMQLGTRCSDGSCEAAEDLISGFSAIEAEAELVQIGLKLCAAAVISAEQECFQVADGFVQPVQVARFILFRVQLHARQVLIASVAVAFDFCTCRNSFADDLLKCFARDVFHDLHPREQRSPVFRF